MPTKVGIIRAMVFLVVMHGCERWTIKKAEHWRIDAFELWYWRRLESPLDIKEIKPINPKGNQPWIFIGRTDATVEAPIYCLPDAKSQLIGKYPDAGKDWRQKETGAAEDKMVRLHHRLNGHEFEQTSGDSEGQGSVLLFMGSQSQIGLSNWTTGLVKSTLWPKDSTWWFSLEWSEVYIVWFFFILKKTQSKISEQLNNLKTNYWHTTLSSVQSLSHVRLCNPMNCSMPGLPVHHQLPESTQTHVHGVGDAIQPSYPLSSPSPPALSLSQH